MSSRAKVKLKIHQMKQGKLVNKATKISYLEISKTLLGFDVEACPCCKTWKMIIVHKFGANAVLVSMPNPPPKQLSDNVKK